MVKTKYVSLCRVGESVFPFYFSSKREWNRFCRVGAGPAFGPLIWGVLLDNITGEIVERAVVSD